jgi:two-component system response regulator AtoC
LRERTAEVAVATASGTEPMVRVEMKLGQQTLADIERAIIDEVVRLANYNKTLAAKHLGLTRFALDRRLKKVEDDE